MKTTMMMMTAMPATPVNVAAAAVDVETTRLLRPGVTLTFTVFAACCRLDVDNVAASPLPSDGTFRYISQTLSAIVRPYV